MATNPFLTGFSGQNPFLVQQQANPFLTDPNLALDPFEFSNDPGGLGKVLSFPFTLAGTLVSELARDFGGTARIGVATAGELFELIGGAAPLTWDDVTQRDLKGLGMIAALGTGIGVTGLMTKTLGTSALTLRGLVMTEAAAGAAYGLVRPLEEDESRVRAGLQDAAFGAAFGAGFSFVRSGMRAVGAGELGRALGVSSTRRLERAARRFQLEQPIREWAGIRVSNKEGITKGLYRDLQTGRVMSMDLPSGAARDVGNDFGLALGDLARRGFVSQEGHLHRTFDIADATNLDANLFRTLQETGSDIPKILGEVRLSEFADVRTALEELALQDRQYASLAAEVLRSSGAETLGTPVLNDISRRGLKKELRIVGDVTDGELLRRGVREGIVNVENMLHGIDERTFLRELELNRLSPQADVAIFSERKDSILTHWLSPTRLAKRFPVLEPLVNQSVQVSRQIDIALQEGRAWIENVRVKYTPEQINRAVDIIDSSGDVARAAASGAQGANAVALARAAEDADPLVPELVKEFIDLLGDGLSPNLDGSLPNFGGYMRRLREVGLLEEAFEGYFPINNARKWRLDVIGTDKRPFQGTFATKRGALEGFEQFIKENPDLDRAKVRADVAPIQYSWAEDVLPDEERLKRLIAKQRAGKRSLGNLQARRRRTEEGFLHLRDFSKDPLDALWIYMTSLERTLYAQQLFPIRAQVLDLISPSQPRLKQWVEDYVNDLGGRARGSEIAIDNILQRMADTVGLDLQPRMTRRYLSAIRRWESFSRLGGVWSSLVNSTQFAINVYPKLGERWTPVGLKTMLQPRKLEAARERLHRLGVDFGPWAPLTREGELSPVAKGLALAKRAIVEGKRGDVKAAAASAAGSFERAMLVAFNGSERVMRIGAAEAAFQRSLSMQKTTLKTATEFQLKAAARAAQDLIDTTLFNYTLADMPSVLRHPALATLFQFKSFFIKEIEFISSLRGAELARFATALTALGGIGSFINMPPGSLLDFASLSITDTTINEALLRKGDEGSIPAKLAYGGLPALIGWDMTNSLGLGTLTDITQGILGPAGSDIQAMAEFAVEGSSQFMANGEISSELKHQYMEKVMPSAFRRIRRGADIETTGLVRDRTGKLLYKPDSRLYATVMASLGAPSLQSQAEYAKAAVVRRANTRFRNVKASFARQAARARLKGDQATVRRVVAEARASGVQLDQRTLNYWVKELQRPAAERRRRQTPLEMREELEARGLIGPDPATGN